MQIWQGSGLPQILTGQRRERLLCAFHRTGINRIEGDAFKKLRQGCCLRVTIRRKLHVNTAAEDALVARLDFAMPQKIKPRGIHSENKRKT